MELLKVDSLEECIDKLYNEYVKNGMQLPTEEIKVGDAYNRILAEDITSNINVPDFDRSVVDGYAVIAKDTEGATDSIPTFLNVVGECHMGEECLCDIKNGECIYVPTGAMMPRGADACVMVEYTESITDKKIAIHESVSAGKYVVKAGSDTKKGDTILKKGTKIKPAIMGYLSSVAVDKVKVYKNLDVYIISTGDELVDENGKLELGKIRDVNSNLLEGVAKEFGFNVVGKSLLKDEQELLENEVIKGMAKSDITIISGGSSKGKKDASSIVIDKLTSSGVLTHGIAIKPGKPTITSVDSTTNTIVLGLPGNPVAAAILFRLIISNLYKKVAGYDYKEHSCEGRMCENLPASPGRMTIQLVTVDSEYNVKPIFGRSGLIHTLSIADGYIVLEKDSEGINRGDKVKVYYI